MDNVRSWTVDDVCRWLVSVNLTNVSTKMEMAGIDGERLLLLNDISLLQQLKINSPSQRIALMAAINSLRGSVVSVRSKTMAPAETRSSTSVERGRSSSTGQQNNPPARKSPAPTKSQPPVQTVVIAPAPKLLDEYCNHSGWIRKRGGSHKSWKHRYLVLRLGHVYYYENETANKPKGHFSLNGYKVVQCNESDNIKKFPWVFKLLHQNPEERTYYISAAAHHEMKKWMDQLNKEIKMISLSPNSSSNTTLSPIPSEEVEDEDQHVYDPVAQEDEDDDDDDEDEDPYDKVEEKLYDKVASGEEDDDNDSDYEKIRDEDGNPLLPASGTHGAQPSSPTHGSKTLPPTSHSPISFPKANTIGWSLTDHTKPRKGKGDAPTVPPRSLESLGIGGQLPPIPFDSPNPHPPPSHSLAPSQPPPPTHPPPPDDEDGFVDDDTYLKLSGDGAVGGSPPSTPDQDPSQKKFIVRGGIEIAVPTVPVKNNSSTSVDPVVEEENPYYITLGSADDVMPSHCVFGPMSRDEAENRLARTQRIGTYLLRDGTHADAEKVLSVWSGQKAKHYKLYKEEKGFCLTHGEGFPTIPMLLQHYKTNETLPKSDYYLGDPYHPADR